MADDVHPNQSPTPEPADAARPAEATRSAEPLPAMADLDRVASELDHIDARLAALDEQRS